MPKLFIFGIGGTGSRVVKALVNLMAAGVSLNASEVVPIIIDPDRSNGDMNRTVDGLRTYQRIRAKLEFSQNRFFNTRLTTLNELIAKTQQTTLASEDFRLEISGVRNERFRDFIDYANLDSANKALMSLLFSEDNLATDMEVGFKGNPNIGSVVLNQFKDSEEFKHFASNFEENDRIFIISSIFGGTGAAGFPLLLKNIRNASASLPNHAFLKNAKVGAITVLPYFGVSPDEKSKIDKATFISKTKAALSYYARNVSGNQSLNALYYIGDRETKDYDNHEGSTAQRNDAHFIELASALGIVDFMNNLDDTVLQNVNGRAVSPVYKEFGIEQAADVLNFKHLGNAWTQRTLQKPLSQFLLLHLFTEQNMNSGVGKMPWSNVGNVKIDQTFLNQSFMNDLRTFLKRYEEWLIEMGRNKIGFEPLNVGVGANNLFALLRDIPAKKDMFGFMAKDNFELLNDRLNAASAESTVKDLPAEQKFMAMTYNATEKVLKDKFDL